MEHIDNNQGDGLDETMKEVMIENNAQFIFEHIKSLGNEPKHRQRWIWELMQNAQDTKATEVTVTFKDSSVTFFHNGTRFRKQDITHLIFHGSSKRQDNDGKTGKFGTGFMTTHLLSKCVKVQGSLDDGRHFNFELSREAEDSDQMVRALNNSWASFKKSLSFDENNIATSFSYLNISKEGIEAVEYVLDNVAFLMPSVLAFAKGIGKVTIFYKNETHVYKKKEPNGTGIITISCISDNAPEPINYNLILHTLEGDGQGVVAIPVDTDGSISTLGEKVPRIFISFPLIGTEKAFPFPFLINSNSFEPNPEREKLWLSADTKEARINKDLLELALEQYINFVNRAITTNMLNIHLLADLGDYKTIDWVDGKWYKEELSIIIAQVDALNLITVAKAGAPKAALSSCLIPSSEVSTSNEDESTWNLCSYLFPEKIPCKDQAKYWQKILAKRSTFLGGAKHPSTYTLRSICMFIDTIAGHHLDNMPTIEIGKLNFIQMLISNLEKFQLEKYWSEYAILPDQNGMLRKSGALQQELLGTNQEIDKALKNIAEGLGTPIREKLLHEQIKITSENHKLQEYKKDTLVALLLQMVRGYGLENIPLNFEVQSERFLEWLLNHNLFNDLASYPVKMRNEKWDKLLLGDIPFLSPASLWIKGFEKYQELFPPEYILNELYRDIFSVQDILKKANEKRILLQSPLYLEMGVIESDDIRQLTVSRADKERLAKEENIDWEMRSEIWFSDIAYFDSPKDKNVIDRARGSFRRTKLFLQFIIDVLLIVDENGFSRKEIEIANGDEGLSISIYPSLWLLALKNKDWVREKGTTNSKPPSVETFLPYFNHADEDNALYKSLQRSDVSKFLHFFEIGVGDLLRNIRSGDNEDERISWDQSYVMILMDKTLTPGRVTGLLGDPDFIKAYEEKQILDKRTRENQIIGIAVEKAFKQTFEGLAGYHIDRRAVGSDYVVECDFPHYLLIDRTNKKQFVVEIKSSRSTEVRMTITQGRTACRKDINYVLCVVPLTEDEINIDTIVKNAKFITNISTLLNSRVTKVEELKTIETETIQLIENDLSDVRISMDGMNVRYVINQNVWLTVGPNLIDFEQFIGGIKIGTDIEHVQ